MTHHYDSIPPSQPISFWFGLGQLEDTDGGAPTPHQLSSRGWQQAMAASYLCHFMLTCAHSDDASHCSPLGQVIHCQSRSSTR